MTELRVTIEMALSPAIRLVSLMMAIFVVETVDHHARILQIIGEIEDPCHHQVCLAVLHDAAFFVCLFALPSAAGCDVVDE